MLSLRERAELYNARFPSYPPLVCTDRWLYGIWVLGNNYRSKQGFYGEYPPNYLARATSLFPDCVPVLHLFSGSLGDDCGGIRFDNDTSLSPDIAGDAERLASYFPAGFFSVIYADPPYSEEDANHYGQCMVNRNRVVSECFPVLRSGGFLVWLDQVLPMYRKSEFTLVGTIGLVRSTNHRFRIVSIFRKGGDAYK
tara:strand:+ start:4960 stop:5547 length:588 start_codon:yes stop_codon:yes gene_type:complete